MARIVKVDLLLEASKYIRGARDAERATDDLADGLDGVARTSKDTTESTEKLGGGLDHLARDARRLDTEIAKTKVGIRDLAREITQTSDAAKRTDLLKQMGLDQRNQRKLVKLRDLIDFDDDGTRKEGIRLGARLAEGLAKGVVSAGNLIGRGFGQSLGSLPPQAQAAIGAGVVGAVAAAAPLIGGVVSAAVVGAAGAGGIVGGIAIAARHPQVQASAKLTGEVFASTMQRAGVSFVPATLGALGKVRAGIHDMEGDLERAFSASSRFVSPLTDSFLSGAKRAVEGFATAAERSGTVMNSIGTIAERFGDVVGDTFEGLSEHSSEAGHALLTLWAVFEFGIRSVAGTIEMLTVAYGWLEKFGAVLTGDTAALGRMVAEQEVAKGSSSGLSDGLQDLVNSFQGAGSAASVAAAKVETFDEMVRRLTEENITAEQANIRLEEAIDQAGAAAKKSGRGIDANTEAGRRNRSALVGIAEAAGTSARAIFAQTGSQELASQATERGRAAFLKSAAAMGVSKKEAKELADKLFGIPKKVDSKVTVTANTQPAIDSAKGVVARINGMHARIRVSAEPSGGYGGSAHTGDGYSTGYRWGGVVEHAQSGLVRLRDAALFSTQAPARYGFAEPATGGEAFIPRRGDLARSRAIWSHVGENWLGMRPAMQPASGGVTVVNRSLHVTVNVPPTVNKAEVGREVVQAVQAYEKSSGTGWRK